MRISNLALGLPMSPLDEARRLAENEGAPIESEDFGTSARVLQESL